MKPALPQRVHNIMAEIAWNPLRLPSFRKRRKYPAPPRAYVTPDSSDREPSISNPDPQAPIRPSLPFHTPPRLLNLDESRETEETNPSLTSPSEEKGYAPNNDAENSEESRNNALVDEDASVGEENEQNDGANGNDAANPSDANDQSPNDSGHNFLTGHAI
ncbi:hypothetical protein ACA910_014114 [Epithemia clementina (nom. ined.)]